MAWHPTRNIVSFVTSDGELYIYEGFLQPDTFTLLQKPMKPSPYIRDPLAEVSGNASKAITNGFKDTSESRAKRRGKDTSESRAKRRGTPDSLDDILGPELGDEDDFVSDDDGAGYLDDVNGFGKRSNGHLDSIDRFDSKRRAIGQGWQPRLHESFQPGSTPWRGNRRYLCETQHL